MSAKILIVEDESLVALEISSALKKEGYSVTGTSSNAKDAFKSIEENLPDLILMDINIDGPVNGIEVSSRINTTYDIPVVFLTAYKDRETIDSAIKTSPSGYLIKPFKRQELYAAITLCMSKKVESSHVKEHVLSECIYYPHNSELLKDTQKISLTKKEKQLLDLLLTCQNSIVSFDKIEYELWSDKSVSPTTRRTLIHRLREKIGGENIKTVKDFGCVLEI
jgi:DNA-binding response OmpR family regulator